MYAFIFPGQGSQYPGMGQQLAQDYREAREVFEEVDEALGFFLSRLCFEGSKANLRLTENTQPAILTVSVAAFRVLETRGLVPDIVAGHSLGEYSALVAAHSLRLDQAVRLVRRRGQLMQQAVPEGRGAMAAILGLEAGQVAEICRRVAEDQIVEPANHNSPVQTVIAGHSEAVQRAVALARTHGARKALPLSVSAPFHCALMVPAEKRLRPLLEATDFEDLRCPLINNVEAGQIRLGHEARRGLILQVSRAVLWQQSIELMVKLGVSEFVEVGPGKVLSGLTRRIDPSAQTYQVESPEQVEALCFV